MHEIILYLWNGLLGILTFGIVILCIIGGNSSQPTFMSCHERRRRYGTLKKKNEAADDSGLFYCLKQGKRNAST